MRTKHWIITLLTVFALMAAMTAVSFAESHSFKGSCTFDGETITADFDDKKIDAAVDGLEPGDNLIFEITYKNGSDATADFYMLNDVLQTLEDSKDVAENGGYTYVLKNIDPNGKEETLFDNSEVGGEAKVKDLVGLKQATNATQVYFFIQELKSGEKAKTHLEVAFDGETEVNDYMDTAGALMVQYAVEKHDTKTKKKKVIVYSPRTGDTQSLLLPIILMTAALLAAVLAIILWRRSRREEGEQQ